MNAFKPIFRSPVQMPDPPLAKVEADLTVTDLTGVPVTLIQGVAAGQALANRFDAVPARPGQVTAVAENGLLARLTPTELYLFGTSPGSMLPTVADLTADLAAASGPAYATDFTHGKVVLKLTGSAAAQLLSKICGLDFHDSAFPAMRAKQSSAAKIKTVLVRADETSVPTYFLHVDRPLGQYFLDTVWDAGKEFGIVALAS